MTLEEAKRIIRKRIKKCKHDRFYYDDEGSRGAKPAYEEALSILKQINTEPAPKDKVTLTELAHELRKVFDLRYLTAESYCCDFDRFKIMIWFGRYRPKYDITEGWISSSPLGNYVVIYCYDLGIEIDFSEYENEFGYIDFSKCIVEVSE